MRNMTVKQSEEYKLKLSEYEKGLLTGLLIGEGHFGGDGRQAQVSLRMHTRHERLFRWLEAKIPGGKLYGPYHHGGRSYFQWMIRGHALRYGLLPVLAGRLQELDDYAQSRLEEMVGKYKLSG